MNTEQKVERYIQEYRMIEPGDRVIVGASGGGDSMALLWMLSRRKERGGFSLYALHVHHGLRGEEADRDAALVESFCRDRKIPFLRFAYDVQRISREQKMGLEEAGRWARDKAFGEAEAALKKESGMPVKIALAHHGTDLAETMLHHMARGTGLRGLAAIRPVNGNKIRPFLCLERAEIEEYLRDRQIPYETDSSNLSEAYTRNRIRHQVLPSLKSEVNTRAEAHMRELSLVAWQADEFLEERAGELLRSQAQPRGEGILIKLPFFENREIIGNYGIRRVLKELSGKSRDLTAAHVHSVWELAGRQVGRQICLPYGLEAVRVYEGILFQPVRREKTGAWNFSISSPGELALPDGGLLKIKIFSYQGQEIPQKKYTKWLDYDKIKGKLCIRNRITGDYLTVNAQGSTKKLNRYLIDEKIPGEQRDALWLIACGSEILWVIGGRIGEGGKISADTRTVLELEYKGGKGREGKGQSVNQ
ncbi:MAG: tRNA lysidine(34) synthetase TilS [Eubacteriales bacterium]|nr:tRNA lysidine(34) synthetase TilS [Eubacteriales bacterium]